MIRLIVSEKENVAKRIASILASCKTEVSKSYNVSIYSFTENSTQVKVIGLRGHILKVDFPSQYKNWQQIDPVKLIDAKIIKVPIKRSIVKALQQEAKDADEVIIATDFDREGELIGLDAVSKIKEVNPDIKVKRARFSALTEAEIKKAFESLEDVYVGLAQAGEARQDIDLVWGAVLTRFLSLASFRLGNHFLSVGRVQSPTLCLIAERERERRAFIPQKYFQIKGLFRKGDSSSEFYEGDDKEEFLATHKQERFWDKEEAEKVLEKLKDKGIIVKVEVKERVITPPTPFNTTAFLSAAASVGVAPAQAMRIAENLYNEGYISYPRVDNTCYPPSLDFRGILKLLGTSSEWSKFCEKILSRERITPTEGKKRATDHPPIHPTGVVERNNLNSRQWKIYELVVRRFLATLADEAYEVNARVAIDASGELFVAKGNFLKSLGWFEFYPYSRKKELRLPELEEKEEVLLLEARMEEKETQPPHRHSQGNLIQEMEKRGLGTKSTRHAVIQNLYDRDYIRDNPIVPTELGLAVCEALKRNAEKISTPDMTAELEKEMEKVAEGKIERSGVVDKSRTMLASVMLILKKKEKEVADVIREGIREDRARSRLVGTCPSCGSNLKVITAKKTGKRFVGCESYPDCKTAYPLPQLGEIVPLRETCSECGTPKVRVRKYKKGSRAWVLCLDPNCPTKKTRNVEKTPTAKDKD